VDGKTFRVPPARAHKPADAHWRDLATRAIGYVHDRRRDPNGWYSRRWDDHDVAALDRSA
jgi:hypothetical protein